MKPPAFDYHDPRTIDDAIALLVRHGGEAQLLAGGQSLVPMLNFRLAAPAVLIDLNRIPDLAYIKEDRGQLCFGAMTRQRQVEFSPLVAHRLPLMIEATRLAGHLPTRTRGTVGGSIAHADPAAEYPAIVTALEGEMVVQGAAGKRVIKAADFFRGAFTTAIDPGEILVEIRMPVTPDHSGWAFEEFSRRHGDFAIVETAVMLTFDANRRCRAARVAVSGAGAIPLRMPAVERMIEDSDLSEKIIVEASAQAAELIDPATDLHASAGYRRHLTRVLVRRALTRAAAQARGRN
ncbi:MAG: xanthine dehydrogenase family protein subunit M [Candidatus Binataceae bacterium]|nr:xanthine dehydrogenase family protein subunit M [Candidatus Binataceae bacterium]